MLTRLALIAVLAAAQSSASAFAQTSRPESATVTRRAAGAEADAIRRGSGADAPARPSETIDQSMPSSAPPAPPAPGTSATEPPSPTIK